MRRFSAGTKSCPVAPPPPPNRGSFSICTASHFRLMATAKARTRSDEADILHIDRHEERLGNRPVIWAHCEDPAPCRRHNAVKLSVTRNIVRARGSAEN